MGAPEAGPRKRTVVVKQVHKGLGSPLYISHTYQELPTYGEIWSVADLFSLDTLIRTSQ